jgi:polysaccharide export outer membrane protein
MRSLIKVVLGVCLAFFLTVLWTPRIGAQTAALPNEAPSAPATVTSAQQSVSPPTSAAPPGTGGLIIGAGDLLVVSVYGAPDFDKEVRVADSGDISLPLIGPARVAGLTVQQAEGLVQQRLSEGGYFTDPQVSIFEKEYATQGISVLGEVQKPGIYPLLGARALFDAVSAAGGLTPKAGNSITITHRNNPKEPQTVVLPANQEFPPEINVAVFPGDTIVVSKAGIVYVVGDVHLPGGFVMENPRLSVLQAVALAQGTNNTAKLEKTVLIRKTANGPKEIPIPLQDIMTAKADDIQLQPEDIVFVPRSTGKAAVRRGLEAILQTATGVAIYRPY